MKIIKNRTVLTVLLYLAVSFLITISANIYAEYRMFQVSPDHSGAADFYVVLVVVVAPIFFTYILIRELFGFERLYRANKLPAERADKSALIFPILLFVVLGGIQTWTLISRLRMNLTPYLREFMIYTYLHSMAFTIILCLFFTTWMVYRLKREKEVLAVIESTKPPTPEEADNLDRV